MKARLFLFALIAAAPIPSVHAQQVPAPQPMPLPASPPRPALAKPKPPVAAVKKKAPAPAAIQAPAVKAKLLQRVGDWSVLVYEDAAGRVCFAAATPKDMEPKSAKRTPVIFYVTDWPKDGIRNEVSVKLGYAMKANAAATVTAGGQAFTLLASDDKVFAKDPAMERKLVAAIANGGAMIVKATSAKGTATTDEYSLDGAAAALARLKEVCP